MIKKTENCGFCSGTGVTQTVDEVCCTTVVCTHCSGSGKVTFQVPTEPEIAAAPKLHTREQIAEIQGLLHRYDLNINDLKKLDGVMTRAKTNQNVGTFKLALSTMTVEVTYNTINHLGIAIRALLVQQEIKTRRLLRDLGVEIPMPDLRDHPYYQNEDYWTLEHLAQLLGKPFNEK